jgi:N-hydroxyarylamine O-acetyltransferase
MAGGRAVDLDAYFERIAWRGPLAPTAAVLAAVLQRHTYTIPFENIDPFLGHPVSLDLAHIADKLIAGGRGGYCLEQNGLLAAALSAMGFEVTPLLARVDWMRPRASAPARRSHLLLRVGYPGGDAIVDAGFSPLTPTAPLHLLTSSAQITAHETFRLECRDEEWQLSVLGARAWQALYRFELTPATAAECHAANAYASGDPDSTFTRQLIVCLARPGERLLLAGERLCARGCDGRLRAVRRLGADEVVACLSESFGIDTSRLDTVRLAQRLRGGEASASK